MSKGCFGGTPSSSADGTHLFKILNFIIFILLKLKSQQFWENVRDGMFVGSYE